MRRLNYEQKDLGYSFALTTTVMVASALVLGLIFGAVDGGWQYWLMQALYTALIGGSAFVYAAISKTHIGSATGISKRPRLSHIAWGCAGVFFLILCMSQINNLFLNLLEALGLNRPSVELEDNLAGLIICACILPAFAEEIVFRGTVAMSLRSSKNKLAALAISGALFSIFHANPAQTLHQFVLGAFLTLLVFRSGSLWTSVIVHLLNNAAVVALSYTPLGSDEFWSLQDNAAWALPLAVVGLVGFAACVFGYLQTTKSCWQTDSADGLAGEDTGEVADEAVSDLTFAKNKKASTTALLVAIFVCAVMWVLQLLV